MSVENLPILKGLLQHGKAPEYMTTVRFGRVPKREKARIAAAMSNVSAQNMHKNILAELEDELRITDYIIQKYLQHALYTRSSIEELKSRARGPASYPSFKVQVCPMTGVNEAIDRPNGPFSNAIHCTVEFAKTLPGFKYVSQEEKIDVLRGNIFEALVVQIAALFNNDNDTVVCINGRLLQKESNYSQNNSQSLMESMFEFAKRFNSCALDDEDIGLYNALILVKPDLPNLRQKESLECMHRCFTKCFKNHINNKYPSEPELFDKLIGFISDLKTLRTLHTERFASKAAQHADFEDSRSSSEDKEMAYDSSYGSYSGEDAIVSPNSSNAESLSGDSIYSESYNGHGNGMAANGRPPYFWGNSLIDEPMNSDEPGDTSLKCPYLNRRKADNSPTDSGIGSSPEGSPESHNDAHMVDTTPLLRQALQTATNKPAYNPYNDHLEPMNSKSISDKPHRKFKSLARETNGHSSTSSPILAQKLACPNPPRSSSSTPMLVSALSGPSNLLKKSLTAESHFPKEIMRSSEEIHALMMQDEERLMAEGRSQQVMYNYRSKFCASPERLHQGYNNGYQKAHHRTPYSKTSPPRYCEPPSRSPTEYREHLVSSPCRVDKYYDSDHSYSPEELSIDSEPLNLSKKTPPSIPGYLVA